MGNFPLIKWEFHGQPCEFFTEDPGCHPAPGGSVETGLATGVGGRCLWAVRNSADSACEKKLCTEWIHNPRRLARRAFKYLFEIKHVSKYCFKPWFLQFFFSNEILSVTFLLQFLQPAGSIPWNGLFVIEQQGFHIDSPPCCDSTPFFLFRSWLPLWFPWSVGLVKFVELRDIEPKQLTAWTFCSWNPSWTREKQEAPCDGGDEIYYESC